jgi:hypothetical protein
MKLGTFILFVVIGLSAQASNGPKQTRIAIKEIPKWIWRNIKGVGTCTLHMTKFGKYDFLVAHPNTFKILDIHAHRFKPKKQWSLAFPNSGSYFKEHCDVEFGLCAGMTYFMRSMNMGAVYDPTNQFEKRYNNFIPKRDTNPDKFVKFYSKKFNKIMANKPQVIPGFKNLRELSEDPLLSGPIKKLIVEQWSRINVSIPGITQYLKSVSENLDQKEITKLYKELKHKTKDLKYNPIIWAARENESVFSKSQWIHMLQVYDVGEEVFNNSGELVSYTIYTWDPNSTYESSMKKKIQIKLDDDPNTKAIEMSANFGSHSERLSEVETIKWDEMYVGDMTAGLLELFSNNPELLKLYR